VPPSPARWSPLTPLLARLVSASTAVSSSRASTLDRTTLSRLPHLAASPDSIPPTLPPESVSAVPAESSRETFVTVIVEAEFNTFTLSEPVRPAFAVSATRRYRAAADFLNVNQCAAIAKDLEADGSRGFYLEASPAAPGQNDCWVIGDKNSNQSLFLPPSATGIPFTPDNAVKRALVESGAVGRAGGTIGFAGAAAEPVPGAGSCDTSLGDTPTVSGVCQCGDGRVPANTENTLCKFTPSAGARLRRAAADKRASW